MLSSRSVHRTRELSEERVLRHEAVIVCVFVQVLFHVNVAVGCGIAKVQFVGGDAYDRTVLRVPFFELVDVRAVFYVVVVEEVEGCYFTEKRAWVFV